MTKLEHTPKSNDFGEVEGRNPQPLKGKDVYQYGDKNKKGYFQDDVRSAVEWLKDKLRTQLATPYNNSIPIDFCEKAIDEAFEDVMKE